MTDRNLELALRLKADMSDAVKQLNRSIREVEKHGKASKRAARDTNSLSKSLDKTASSAGRSSSAIKQSTTQVGLLAATMRAAGGAVAAYVAIDIAKEAIQQADAYKLLQARVKLATEATGDFAQVSESIFQISQSNGTALEDSVSLFQQLARIAPELNATNQQILQLMNAVQQLGVVSGASQPAMQNGLLQFSQAMAGGIVRAEEFNSILENIPALAQAIADGMGTTVGKLRLAVVEGKVLSQDVFNAVLSQTDAIAEKASRIPLSIEKANQVAANGFQRLAAAVDKWIGATDTASYVIARIGRGMERGAKFFEDLTSEARELKKIDQDMNHLFEERLRLQERIAEAEASGIGRRRAANLRAEVSDIDQEMTQLANRRKELLGPLPTSTGPVADPDNDPTVITVKLGNDKIQELGRQRKQLIKEIDALRDELTPGTPGQDDPSEQTQAVNVTQLARARAEIKSLVQSGDVEGALDKIERAKDIIEELKGQTGISDQYLRGALESIADFTTQISETSEGVQIQTQVKAPTEEQIQTTARESYEKLYAEFQRQQQQADGIPMTVDKDGAIKEAEDTAKLIQVLLNQKPLVQRIIYAPQVAQPNLLSPALPGPAPAGATININQGLTQTIETGSISETTEQVLRALEHEAEKRGGRR